MSERFEPDELAAAANVDRAVDDLLAGRSAAGVDPATTVLLERLVHAHRAEPPPALAARVRTLVRDTERRLWLPVRVAAAALAVGLIGNGLGNFFVGSWVARSLDVAYDSHAFFEGGVVLCALGGVLLAGAVVRRWLDLAVLAGAPVGLAFALNGLSELSEFPEGGLVHLSQGAMAVALAVLWWRARRYVLPLGAKRGT